MRPHTDSRSRSEARSHSRNGSQAGWLVSRSPVAISSSVAARNAARDMTARGGSVTDGEYRQAPWPVPFVPLPAVPDWSDSGA